MAEKVAINADKQKVLSAVLDKIEKDFGKKITPEGFHVFLCGNPRMVDETVEIFLQKGFTRHTLKEKGNLYFDKH